MSIIHEERLSDSTYIETIIQGRTTGDGFTIRPAESHWHMVLVKHEGNQQLMVVGPWTKAGMVTYTAGVDLLWIKFKLGTFMPHLPVKEFRDLETTLPGGAG